MDEMPKRIIEVAQQLKDGQTPRRYTVRAVLKWFGASRRGANVLSDVKIALADLGLQTDPVFEEAGIDELVRFVLASPAIKSGNGNAVLSPEPVLQPAEIDDPLSTLASGGGNGSNGASETASEDQLEPEPE